MLNLKGGSVGFDEGDEGELPTPGKLAKMTPQQLAVHREVLAEKSRQLDELSFKNRRFLIENEVLSSYLRRVSLPLFEQALSEVTQEQKTQKQRFGTLSRTRSQFTREQLLSPDDMADIVQSEIYMLSQDIDKTKTLTDEQTGDLAAMLEEAEMRIQLAKKDIYEFKRDIVLGAEDVRSGKIMAEKMLKFLEEQLHSKDQLIDKLQLKNQVMRTQIGKIEQQLSQKEELGEDLHVIDFDQLKIENQQYLERIEEKNKELLQLKLTTGKTVQILNTLKNKLQRLSKQGDFLRKQISLRTDQLRKIEIDIDKANKDSKSLDTRRVALKLEENDPEAPQIMDYVKVKAEIGELEKELAEAQRKLGITEREDATVRSMASMAALSRAPSSGGVLGGGGKSGRY